MNLESYITPYARAVVCLLKGAVNASTVAGTTFCITSLKYRSMLPKSDWN